MLPTGACPGRPAADGKMLYSCLHEDCSPTPAAAVRSHGLFKLYRQTDRNTFVP